MSMQQLSKDRRHRTGDRSSRGRLKVLLIMAGLLASVMSIAPTPVEAQDGRHPDVDRLYCAYFLREAEPGGQAYWYSQRDQNKSLVWIAEFFSQSEEFKQTYGQQVSTGDFVRLIYRNLFNRTPDAGGFDYWVDRLDRGELQRGSVMAYFSESPEFKERIVEVGCGNTGPGSTPPPGSNADPAVASALDGMRAWQTPTKVSTDSRSLTTLTSDPKIEASQRVITVCRPQGVPVISQTFNEFPAFAFAGPTLPGLIVEGSGIPEGDLRVLPLERSPIKLVSDTDSANPVRVLNNPTTSSVQAAVSELKRDADARLTGLDVVASDINYTRQESHSFEESSLNVGVSLHYESATIDAGFKTDFEQTNAVERHSISVRLVQPMFTLRVERDSFTDPQDYLSANVTKADIDQLVAQGKLGTDNPPVLIETVTYGRIMAFTMTSESAESASELMAAVGGAYGGMSGEANLTDRQRSLLRTSSTQMMAYGGDQGLALAAIQSGDLDQFFGPANTTTASPLTMGLRTLDGTRVDVADEATLKQIVCENQSAKYQFRVRVANLQDGDAEVLLNGQVLASATSDSSPAGEVYIDFQLPANQLNDGENTVIVRFEAGGCLVPFTPIEKIDAAIWRRGSSSEGWGGVRWSGNWEGCAYFFDWTITINTTTGAVVEQ